MNTLCRDAGRQQILRLWKWLPREFRKGRTTGCPGYIEGGGIGSLLYESSSALTYCCHVHRMARLAVV